MIGGMAGAFRASPPVRKTRHGRSAASPPGEPFPTTSSLIAREEGGLEGAVRESLDLVVWGRGDFYVCVAPVRENPSSMADGTIAWHRQGEGKRELGPSKTTGVIEPE